MKKKLFALLLSAAMCASLFAGCGSSSDDATATEDTAKTEATDFDPVNDIAGSYYDYYYYSGDMLVDYYFHFYDEVPGIGNVYYAGFCMNQINYAGTYEVVEEETSYACFDGRDSAAEEGAEATEGTAPYKINFYDFDGNLVDSCAYDGDYVYEDMENIAGTGGTPVRYGRETDVEGCEMADDIAGEVGQPILTMVNPDDDTSTLTLYHNGRYSDMVNMLIEGTYEMDADKTDIKLTPDSSSDPSAEVTLQDDGSYKYLPSEGDEVTLQADTSKEVQFSLLGSIPVPGMEDTDAELWCYLYTDGTCALIASAFGTDFTIDEGTYAIDMETTSVVMTFDNAGEISTYADGESMYIDYKGTDPSGVFGDIEQTLQWQ